MTGLISVNQSVIQERSSFIGEKIFSFKKVSISSLYSPAQRLDPFLTSSAWAIQSFRAASSRPCAAHSWMFEQPQVVGEWPLGSIQLTGLPSV